MTDSYSARAVVVCAGARDAGWRRIVAVWIRRSRTRRALKRSDDRLLADVGLTRAEAAREASRPFWR